MAWPPPVLPINRTNATPQLNTHAADHNALAQAINDTVPQVQTLLANKPAYWVQANQTGQAIAGTVEAQITWGTINNPAWSSGAALVVPAGGDGVYVVSARLSGPPPPGPVTHNLKVVVATETFIGYMTPVYTLQSVVTFAGSLVAGTAITVYVRNGDPAAQTFGCLLTIARIAPLN